jgi:hypothetical protein
VARRQPLSLRWAPYSGTVLIDRFLPKYDMVERHGVQVAATPERAYRAIRRVDLGRSPTVRLLFGLRGIRGAGRTTLDDLVERGFVLLGEEPGEEVVLGIVGRFWTPRGGLVQVEPEGFTTFEDPGYAKAAWNFRARPLWEGTSMVTTETRVRCTDDGSRRAFRRYWRLVGPFSAAIRRRALDLVKRDAEGRRSG